MLGVTCLEKTAIKEFLNKKKFGEERFGESCAADQAYDAALRSQGAVEMIEEIAEDLGVSLKAGAIITKGELG